MYSVVSTNRFRKDLKSAIKRQYDLSLLNEAVDTLAEGNPLPAHNKDHALSGKWKAHRECHLTPDWLLIYKIEKDILVLTLTRTGTHSDLLE